jgi:hypothetical protein
MKIPESHIARLVFLATALAEKLGLIQSTDHWMEMRRLRNQIFVPELVAAARRCVEETQRLLQRTVH